MTRRLVWQTMQSPYPEHQMLGATFHGHSFLIVKADRVTLSVRGPLMRQPISGWPSVEAAMAAAELWSGEIAP